MEMGKFTALVVDSDSTHAATVAHMLRSKGYRVEKIYDGWSALMTLMSEMPDLLILKPHLPIVSGAEIATYVRTGERCRRTRIVVVSHQPVEGRLRRLADVICDEATVGQEISHLLPRTVDSPGVTSSDGSRFRGK